MLSSLFNRINHWVVTLRYSILTIFIIIFVTAVSVLISINYVRFSKTMIYIATDLMQQAVEDLYYNFKTELVAIQTDNETTAWLIQKKILNPNDIIKMTKYINKLNSELAMVQQAYWCDEQGDCINSLYEPNSTLTSDLIFNSKNPPYREYWHRDTQGNIINKVRQYQFDYDPRVRPWYIDAKNAKHTIWTDVYLLKDQPHLALTVATPVYSQGALWGVYGMDVRLDWLSEHMEDLKISQHAHIFIVSNSGKIIAFPEIYKKEKRLLKQLDIHSINMPWIIESFDQFQKTGKNIFTFSYRGKTYLANYLQTKDLPLHNVLIGVVAPEDDFIAELKKSSLTNIEIGLIIMLAGILLISAFSSLIAKPIIKLVKQTNEIKEFNLENDERVKSRIKEVMLLSDSVYSMRVGLRSFKKYVPATLVRQLIELGQDVKIGGSKKNLVIFFSDIKNFTTIAEHKDPTQLLEMMSQYFEELSKIIVAENGTIDKYIGDSIMAFWGAPLPVKHPCHAAAGAALKAIQRIQELGLSLSTRIGVHMGDVIVGNVGSSERLNYTALGDAINVASRLEELNKIYGTSIIVSEEIFQKIKQDFVLRKLDCVVVKGKTKFEWIYQLLAQDKNQLSYDIDKYNDIFAKGFAAYQAGHWDEAMHILQECLQVYPEDTLAKVFISRCENFKLHPPMNWDGVWRIVTG